MDLEQRKKKLQQIAIKNYSSGGVIYKIIKDGYLDHIIKRINDKETKTNSTAIIKKGFLTGNEQFISLLTEFYYYFETNFLPLEHKEFHLCSTLENKIPEFLLCKNYWGDNNYINYFTFNMNKIIVENIYDNIKFVYDDYKHFFKNLKISNKLNLNNQKNINLIFNFAIELIWCNCSFNQYSFNHVFSNCKSSFKTIKEKYGKSDIEASYIVKKDYVSHWGILIEYYEKNIEYVQKIIKR